MTTKDDAHIARLKARIGYHPEPVRDAQGYWCIGYGRRLNDKPGGPKPEAYWSEQFADEELRYRVERSREEIPQARELAALGRGDDTEIAHMTLGEIVIPSVLQTPEVMNALLVAAAYAGVPLDRFRIGMPQNSINPETGVTEFEFGEGFNQSFFEPIRGREVNTSGFLSGADEVPREKDPPLMLDPPSDQIPEIVIGAGPTQKEGWSGEDAEIGVGASHGVDPPSLMPPTAEERGLNIDPFIYRYSPPTHDRMIQRGLFKNEFWDI